MFPHERSLVKNLAGKSFALIGVNSDKSLSAPQGLTSDGTVTWRSFQNGPPGAKAISDAFGVRGWPTIYLIDAKGIVRSASPGRGKSLNKAIAELLEEIGEEFPAEEIEADTKVEEEEAGVASSGGGGGDGARGLTMEQYKKRKAERAKKRPSWKDEKPEDDDTDSEDQ